MERALTPAQMADAEKASELLGVSLWELMCSAGSALAEEICLAAENINAEKITILCGNGNNGGDGFVCAKILLQKGFDVKVMLICGEPKTELAKKAFAALDGAVFAESINDTDILVDCVFGTGFHGQFRNAEGGLFEKLSKKTKLAIACDMPSGVDPLRGSAAAGTLKCDITVTFHAKKLGMELYPAREFCGKIIVRDIGIPENWENELNDKTQIFLPKLDELRLKPRPAHSHKGTFGTALIIAGSREYIGAAAVCSRAALRTGAGIVRLASCETVACAIANGAPECVYDILPEDIAEREKAILDLVKKADSVVIGCGMGNNEKTLSAVKTVIKNAVCPVIIDADGINQLAAHIDILKDKSCEVVLTPHIGELARLCGVEVKDVLQNRYALCKDFSEKYSVTLLSKDSSSMIFSHGKVFVCSFGNSALAKGGSGDMLAGVIGSLCAQSIAPDRACLLACAIVGHTAKELSKEFSPAYLTATDIIGHFGKTLAAFE